MDHPLPAVMQDQELSERDFDTLMAAAVGEIPGRLTWTPKKIRQAAERLAGVAIGTMCLSGHSVSQACQDDLVTRAEKHILRKFKADEM